MLLNQQAMLPTDSRLKIIKPALADYSAIDVFKLEEIMQVGVTAAELALD